MTKITARHKLTGIVAEFPAHYLTHPVLGVNLELVDEEVCCTNCELPTDCIKNDEPEAPAEVEVEEILVEEEPDKTKRKR